MPSRISLLQNIIKPVLIWIEFSGTEKQNRWMMFQSGLYNHLISWQLQQWRSMTWRINVKGADLEWTWKIQNLEPPDPLKSKPWTYRTSAWFLIQNRTLKDFALYLLIQCMYLVSIYLSVCLTVAAEIPSYDGWSF